MKNKRGFTLIELLVSFTLITIVSISMFKTVLSVQKKEESSISYNKYLAFVATFNSAIETDFISDTITAITSCGTNCYEITYETAGVKQISIDVDEGTIVYGSIKEELPNNYIYYNDMELNTYESIPLATDSFNAIVEIKLPIKSNLSGDYSDIIYVYQYNSINDPITET